MFGEIIKSLFITSLAGSVLAGILALAKPVTRRVFGYAWHYYIWLAVLIVFLLPVRISLPQNTAAPVVIGQEVQTQDAPQSAPAEINKADAPAIATKVPALPDTLAWLRQMLRSSGQRYLVLLWLTGAIGLLLTYLMGYFLLLRKIRKTSAEIACPELRQYTSRKVRVLESSAISMPFMTGVFRPMLILPKRAFTPEQLHNILRHEMTHFRRRDILYKWFAAIVKCVHWFNPVIYYVARQINTECEISCDLSATAKMNQDEEQCYVETILSMLSLRKTKAIPLTTGMAESKKILKRRFEMMKNRRNTSRLMSVLSAVLAVFMLSTTVFASGVLSGLNEDTYTIMFSNNAITDEEFEFQNKAFIENGEVYMPLRDLFYVVGAVTHNDDGSYINWDNGKIDLCVHQFYDMAAPSVLYNYQIEIGKKYLIYEPNSEEPNAMATREMNNAPILRNDITYIPYSYVDYMINNDKRFCNVNYSVYDKYGNLIGSSGTVVASTSQYENTTPEYAIDRFFQFFQNGNFANMKRYCTESCVSSFFGDGYCFGMTQAKLENMEIEPQEYAKSSNDFVVSVSVSMTPYEHSVYREGQTENAFCVILQRQPDGRYLIDEFATGL